MKRSWWNDAGRGALVLVAAGGLLATTAHAAAPLPIAATAPARSDNPAAAGFNQAGSDPQAVALADATMAAMGGRAAWDKSRYLVWRFFGSRLHIWDRYTGRERIEYTDRKSGHKKLVLMNINTKQGQVFDDGHEITDAAQREAALQRGLEIWINDSYWLLMPYKLKDSGVTLRYKGVENMADGRPADVIVMTFAGVGVTPENKYEVYIARDNHLVGQWAYFEKAGSSQPDMVTPWTDWRSYGGIQLSGGRGKDGSLTDLAVLPQVPDAVFTSPAPVDLRQLGVPAAR
jgi:hypothetical protein